MEQLIPQSSLQHLPFAECVRLMRGIVAKFGLALALACATVQAQERGDYVAARSYAEEALAIFRQTGDRWTRAYVLLRLGEILTAQGQCARLNELYTEGLLMAQQSGSTYLTEQFEQRLAVLQQTG